MRKSIKITIGVGSAIAVAAPAITVPLMMKFNTHIFNKGMFEANKSYSIKHKAAEYKSTSANIRGTAEEADINLFFTPAVAPFNNLLRLSMLTTKENHFFLIRGSDNEGFEDNVDGQKLEDFYNNDRKVSEGKSTVVNVEGNINSAATDVLAQMHEIINKNMDKKINIWWNDTWVEAGYWKDRVLNLAGFKNVNVQLIEDGASQGLDMNHLSGMITKNEWDGSSIEKRNKAISAASAPGIVRGWYSSDEFDALNSLNGVQAGSYNKFEYKELSDAIFNERDKNDARLMGQWPAISGLDWKHEAKTVMNANKNGKKDLIVLGSYGVEGEEDYIMSVWKRYHGQYNIFYKGHPGHMDHPLFVKREMLDKNLESMYQLEPMISSEELTRDHIKPDADGLFMKFDKVIAVGHTSAITASSFPNINIEDDVIEIYNGKGADGKLNISVNPTQDAKSTNWDATATWLKSKLNS